MIGYPAITVSAKLLCDKQEKPHAVSGRMKPAGWSPDTMGLSSEHRKPQDVIFTARFCLTKYRI
jgi:hypothetical protein